MRSRDFAFWLQGLFELGGANNGLTVQQVEIIKQHLGLVFRHDPEIGAPAHPPVSLPQSPTVKPSYFDPHGISAPVDTSSILIC